MPVITLRFLCFTIGSAALSFSSTTQTQALAKPSATSAASQQTSGSSSDGGLATYILEAIDGGAGGPVQATGTPESSAETTSLPSRPVLTGNASAIRASLYSAIPSTAWTEATPTTSTTIESWPSLNGTGFAYASACFSQFIIYSSWQANTASTYIGSSESTYLAATITTLCDGQPRVVGTVTPTSTSYSLFNTSSALFGVMPSCTVAADDCSRYRSSWTSASEAFNTWSYAYYTSYTLDPAATALTTGNDLVGYSTFKLNGSNSSLPTLTIDNLRITASPPASISGCTQCASASYYKFPWQQVGSIGHASLASMTNPYYIVPGSQWAIAPPWQDWRGGWQDTLCTMTQKSPDSDTCGPCTIHGGNVRLYFFPVTSNASRNMCATQTTDTGTVCPFGKTIPVTTTEDGGGPSPDQQPCSYYPMNFTTMSDFGPSAVYDGQTFYANKAYISLEEVYATNGCGQVGQKHGGTIMTLQSSDIYSVYDAGDPMYAFTNFRTATSFNFADLNPNVPAIAYDGAKGCQWDELPNNAITRAFDGVNEHGYRLFGVNINGQRYNECQIIIDAGYAPVLAVPPQILTIDPEWSSCALNLEGLYDPPHALGAATSEIGVSMPTSNASPASSATSPGAPKTTQAVATPITTTQDGVSASGTARTASTSLQPESSATQSDLTYHAQSLLSGSNDATDPTKTTEPQDGHSSADPSSNQATAVIFSFTGTTHTASNTDGSGLYDPAAAEESAPSEFNPPAAPSATTTVVAGSRFPSVSQASGSQVVVNDGTLSFGNSGTVVDGQTAKSTGKSGLLLGTSSSSLPIVEGGSTAPGDGEDPAATTAVIGSQTFTVSHASQSGFVVNGVSIAASATNAMANGQTVEAAGTTEIIIGASTIAIPAPSQSSEEPNIAFTASGQALTASSGPGGAAIIGSATISSGAATTISGAALSVGGDGLVVGGMSTLPYATQSRSTRSQATVTFEASGEPLTASEVQVTTGSVESAAIALGSVTIAQGQLTTLDGMTISAGSNGLVLGSSTTIALAQLPTRCVLVVATFTVGGQTVTASQLPGTSSLWLIGSSTVLGGEDVTVNGVGVSLENSDLVVGGTRTVVPMVAATSTRTSLPAVITEAATSSVSSISPSGSSVTNTSGEVRVVPSPVSSVLWLMLTWTLVSLFYRNQ